MSQLVRKTAPRETENNDYAKFRGDKQKALWYVMVSVFFGKEDDQPEKMIMATKSAVENGELYKCLPCDWFYTVRRKEVRV